MFSQNSEHQFVLRPQPFTASVLLHCAAAGLLAGLSVNQPTRARDVTAKKYTVRLISLQRENFWQPEASHTSSNTLAFFASPGATMRRDIRAQAKAQVLAAKQTLVESDVPPEVLLEQDVPLPFLLLEGERKAPPFRSEQVEMAAVSERSRARETMSSAAQTQSFEISPPAPQEKSHISSPPTVISIPDDPVLPRDVMVLPPANQIAGNKADSSGTGEKVNGDGCVVAGCDSGVRRGGTDESGAGAEPGLGSGLPNRNPLTTAGQEQKATEQSSFRNGSAISAQGLNELLPGTTRITLPKDGNFGVVVTGSAASTAYEESAAALSGNIINTVYLPIGLRKKWTLQYCLPRNSQFQADVEKGETGIEAPWPFVMVRPDEMHSTDGDYVLLHGTITATGQFENLVLVSPENFAGKELLLGSLKQWQFRAARLNGETTEVEVLLIIPLAGE